MSDAGPTSSTAPSDGTPPAVGRSLRAGKDPTADGGQCAVGTPWGRCSCRSTGRGLAGHEDLQARRSAGPRSRPKLSITVILGGRRAFIAVATSARDARRWATWTRRMSYMPSPCAPLAALSWRGAARPCSPRPPEQKSVQPELVDLVEHAPRPSTRSATIFRAGKPEVVTSAS